MSDEQSARPAGKQGFASMTPEQKAEVASMGGKALRPDQRTFSINRELAVEAGRKGGQSTPPEKRPFSIDRERAREAGRKGGAASARRRGQTKKPV